MKELKELQQKLADLKDREFMLQMCDHWDSSDYRYSWQLNEQIKEVKQKIKELEERGV